MGAPAIENNEMSNFPIHGGAPCTRYAMRPGCGRSVGQCAFRVAARFSGRQVRQARLMSKQRTRCSQSGAAGSTRPAVLPATGDSGDPGDRAPHLSSASTRWNRHPHRGAHTLARGSPALLLA